MIICHPKGNLIPTMRALYLWDMTQKTKRWRSRATSWGTRGRFDHSGLEN